jgi:two-component system sensor histidine kinase FlrB
MMSFLRNKHGPSALVCVAELLDECRLTIEPLYESKGVVLKLEVQGGEHLLSVQRDQIRGGLVSLLENALQVSNEGQSVRVVAKAAHARLSVTIDDDGPGIAQDMMQRLFEPFATGSARGTGLGLAIAKAAVEAHRGQIQAENRKDGGARFHIVLPVLEQL